MDVRNACRGRSIAHLDAATPLLVPSFSSQGFRDVDGIHALTKEYLVDVSLVSAYDLHYGLLVESDIYVTDLLFLDSGGYEARATSDPLDPYADDRCGRTWTPEQYDQVLRGLRPLSGVVFVNFDYADPQPLADQVEQARTLFDAHPRFAGDFLCKPSEPDTPFVDVDEVLAHIDDLARFDLVGLTEKELGPSLLDRCRNLLRIRGAFCARGHDTPIHVFGSLDPATVMAYFLCGADVFDGLAWLRFAFREGVPIYHGTGIVAAGAWSARDEDVIMLNRVQNLAWIKSQQRLMHRFSLQYKQADLGPARALFHQVLPLVRAAGLEIEE